MNILCIGDVVGQAGSEHLRKMLPGLKRRLEADICIVNGENAAEGNGITPAAAERLFDAGADVVTGGNHTFRRPEFYEYLDTHPAAIRPANLPASAPGHGMYIVDRGRYQVAVINLMGVVYMDPIGCPFETLDRLLNEAGNPKYVLVDFHAEATAEKKALAFYADGRISALFGTHTHVPTADEQILPKGTGYITDLGMTGAKESVLGIVPKQSIARFRGDPPSRYTDAGGKAKLECATFEIDETTGRCVSVSVTRISE